MKIFKSLLRYMPVKMREKLLFYWHLGYFLDTKNPRSFNQLIACRKLDPKSSIFSDFCDKAKVKEIVSSSGVECQIIKTYIVTDRLELSTFENLPFPLVIKCTHDSGSVKLLIKKQDLNNQVIDYFNARIKNRRKSFYNESWYNLIEPKIIVEEAILDTKLAPPLDYKFHVFKNTDSCIIQVDYDRFADHKRNLFSEKGELLDFEIKKQRSDIKLINEFPVETGVSIAKELAGIVPADYVRVDLYYYNDTFYFGEFTFAHGGGFEKFTPIAWDFKLGAMWTGR